MAYSQRPLKAIVANRNVRDVLELRLPQQLLLLQGQGGGGYSQQPRGMQTLTI